MGTATSKADSGTTLCASSAEVQAKHSELAAQMKNRGVDTAAMMMSAKSFDEGMQPRRYRDPPWSLPPNAVRVVALPLDDEALTDTHARNTARLALTAAEQLAAALPRGSHTWRQPAGTLHTTIYHPGVSPTARAFAPGQPAPTEHQLQQELQTVRRLATSVPINLSLVVDRLALTSSGVLLLLLKPRVPGERACVASLRAAAAAAFPHAAHKQTSGLVHLT